jgi:prephenate dehydrogenase
MQETTLTVGIIGLGSFGMFLAGLIPENARVIGYDSSRTTISGIETVDFSTVASADIVILAVPLQALPAVLERLKGSISAETLLVDVCSVKMTPENLYATILPSHTNLLLTHPLFGPQSAAHGTKGHRLIVTKNSGVLAERVVGFCQQKLQLEVSEMSAKEHDQVMARVHALTFFVARSLGNMNLQEEIFMTPSYGMLMDLVNLDRLHSEELFQTVEQGNPYAKQERERLLASFAEIEAKLE